MEKQYTLITGASSGIGKSMAYKFAKEGHNLILSARRENLLEEIKKEIEETHNIDVIIEVGDITKKEDLERLYNLIKENDVNVLINNAGFGDFGFAWDMDLDKADNMLDLNIKSLTELSIRYAKDYGDKKAVLLNVSSVGGYGLMDVASVYCATKFYVSSFTESLARSLEANGKKLQAKVIAPGATRTEFIDRAEENASMKIGSSFPEEIFITSDQLADYAFELYKSDKVVGYVNMENKLELKDPIFPVYR